ncbi:MAG: DUF2269 family protein [Gammaproteobacteria bacterium]|nr:DUF2269 family protein [Gammaproteobacteria bacterium]
MLAFIKFFHIFCGISFFGLMMASFFYIARSINTNDRDLINYSIKTSYFADVVILLCITIQTVTSLSLVSSGGFNLHVPWILVAYHAFALLFISWVSLFFIKKNCFSKNNITSWSIKTFYGLNILIILFFIIIVHDAITQSTGFEFLFIKKTAF